MRWRLASLAGRITEPGCQSPPFDAATPDLNDPATKGCLLALVREVWWNPLASVTPMEGYDGDDGWRAGARDEPDDGEWGATEAEALVSALEAAP